MGEEVARLNLASYGLTSREEEIVMLVARGLWTRGISASLFISEHTVRDHLRSVLERAGATAEGRWSNGSSWKGRCLVCTANST